MKLPDFFKFEPLNRLRSQMGIPDDQYGSFSLEIDPGRLTSEELDRLTGEGIDVYFDELTILSNGTFAYKDSRVLLYIRDVHVYGHQESEPRYHLFNCTTLKEMSQKGRFDRYVVSNKSNGEFRINILRNKRITTTENRRLCVCQNCLDGLQMNGFNLRMRKSDKKRLVAEFVPDDFFKIYPRSLHAVKPRHDSDTAPLNVYPPDFQQISERLRRGKGWQCQKCQQILSPPHLRQYLHVHHVNGNRSDNIPQNLKILCVACHAEEPQHSHMRNAPALAEFIKLNPGRRGGQIGLKTWSIRTSPQGRSRTRTG